MNNEVMSLLEKKFDHYAAELKRLVDIRSVREDAACAHPFGDGCARVLDEAGEIAAIHGFKMHNLDYYAGEIDLGDDPSVMILAHLDVVPEGDGWTRKPYDMTVEGDLLYGRGTIDDKGAALAALYALDAVKEVLGIPKGGVRLVLGCGEETGSEDMEYYFRHRQALKYTFTPDASYPLINIEKGRYSPTFKKYIPKSDKCVKILDILGGTTANIVPGTASARISGADKDKIISLCSVISQSTSVQFTVSEEGGIISIAAKGQTAHASTPDHGNNAQTALILVLGDLDTDLKEDLDFLARTFPHGESDGASLGVKMSDEISGALTLNFGILSFNEQTLTVNFDMRCPICADDGRVRDITENVMLQHGFESDMTCPSRAHAVDAGSEPVKKALDIYEEFTGQRGTPMAIGGGTYVHDIPGGIAFGVEFPGRDYHMHGADEYASVSEMLLTAKMYAQLIIDLCYLT